MKIKFDRNIVLRNHCKYKNIAIIVLTRNFEGVSTPLSSEVVFFERFLVISLSSEQINYISS